MAAVAGVKWRRRIKLATYHAAAASENGISIGSGMLKTDRYLEPALTA